MAKTNHGAAKFLEGGALLKKALKEVSGLDTAATRDATLERLKYAKCTAPKDKTLDATPKGVLLIEGLEDLLPEMADVDVTARWEAELGYRPNRRGPAFEAKVVDRAIKLVATLKAAPALSEANSTTPTRSLTP